uniref:Nuclear receptor domain-containing protein n=1 Tax=Panagrolaimus davidi TaxID=227884 RepID=A0A914QZ81_9BILA
MDNKVPCGVCSEPISASCRRYGGRACNSCAAFFIRVIRTQQSFDCIGINNECLKTPTKLGKGCKRCRYDKCIEIGMSTNGMIPIQKAPEPKPEKSTIFASILNSILNASITSPNLLISYLSEHNGQLFSDGFKTLEGVALIPMSDKITLLSYVLKKFPITQNEFPALIQLSLCKLQLQHLQIEEQLKIQAVQNAALLKISNFHPIGSRLIELSNISQHFLNVFYIF